MLVEIELIGKSNHWSYRKALILVGRDSKCDVSLNEYPTVSREHLALELGEDGTLTFSDRGANGTFLNGKRLSAGIIHSGDTLRLGADGPELRLRLTQESFKASATPDSAETIVRKPERELPNVESESAATVLSGSSKVYTTVGYVETIVAQPQDVDSSASDEAAVTTIRVGSAASAESHLHVEGGESAPSGAARPHTADADTIPVRVALGTAPTPHAPHGASTPNPANLTGLEIGDHRVMDKKLDSIRNLLAANLAVTVILLLAALYQGQQINKNKDALTEIREEAQNAVKDFTPALDQRLKTMEQRMDGLDGKMKQAEDRFVERMNKELPSVMDKYVNRKLEEMKRQVAN